MSGRPDLQAGDERLLARALALAADNARAARGGPFGAVVARGGVVLGEGVNRVTEKNDPTAHAEVEAIRAACAAAGAFHLPGAVLYSSCEPCPMCLAAAYWARLERVVYAARREDADAAGFADGAIYEELGLPPAERSLPAVRLLAEEGAVPFAVWLASQGRVPY
jgi:tRNA(Arg) A34 adenosine deaminase TadA